ncbi:MAG: hypothetical protein ABIG30_03465 [Candidatus Aenigmatarchaeota archaeon]
MGGNVPVKPHGLPYSFQMLFSNVIPKLPEFKKGSLGHRLDELYSAGEVVRVSDGWHYYPVGEQPNEFVVAYNTLNRKDVVRITADTMDQFQTREEYEAHLAERDVVEQELATSRQELACV